MKNNNKYVYVVSRDTPSPNVVSVYDTMTLARIMARKFAKSNPKATYTIVKLRK